MTIFPTFIALQQGLSAVGRGLARPGGDESCLRLLRVKAAGRDRVVRADASA